MRTVDRRHSTLQSFAVETVRWALIAIATSRRSMPTCIALQRLRMREFEAGRYDPALRAASPPTYTFQQTFPPSESFPAPGAQHASINAALEASGESGTGSILDIFGISDSPTLGAASPVTEQAVRATFGTRTPTHRDFEAITFDRGILATLPPAQLQLIMEFWDQIGRGEARVMTVYEGDVPTELFFAGMSID